MSRDVFDSDDGGPERPDLPILPGWLVIVAIAVVAIVSLAAVWWFRPWLQGLIYTVYTSPNFLVVIGLTIVATIVAAKVYPEGVVYVLPGVLLASLLIIGALSGLFAADYLGHETMAQGQVTDELVESDADTPRIVTRSVADRYASNTLNFPQYRASSSDVTVHNGSVHWSYALSPDGIWNHFTKPQHGTVFVNMAAQNADVSTVTGNINHGIGTAFYNNWQWRTLKRGQYLVNYQDPFMVVHEGEQFVVAPYTKPTFHWLPLPHTTPVWGGVALVDSDGNVADLSPEEARNHDALEGQRLYPFDLAGERVASTKYRNGIINTFTSHNEEIEVAPVPGAGNSQPFMVLSEAGPQYIVAVEPYGDAQGLKEVWTVDSRTGEFEQYVPAESLFGPRKASDYVRQAARQTDWDRFNPAEPIPVVVDGELFWEVRVVPGDSSGIAYIAFVSAQSGDVVEVEETQGVVAFLEGDRAAINTTDPSTDAGSDRTPTIIFQRVAPNGTVLEEMQVYGNETVEVQDGGSDE